jgi:hypothetical protein
MHVRLNGSGRALHVCSSSQVSVEPCTSELGMRNNHRCPTGDYPATGADCICFLCYELANFRTLPVCVSVDWLITCANKPG